ITSASTSTPVCPGFDSVPELLKNYSLPAGLFQVNVATFECSPIQKTNKLNLTILILCTRQTCCRVITINFTAVYERTISATIFENNLIDLKCFLGKFSEVQPLASVTDVLAFFNMVFQLKTTIGFSPPVLLRNKIIRIHLFVILIHFVATQFLLLEAR
ncbi:Glutamyl-tRNA(Gln) amidotransferase subunit A, partial [Bienertia sinuspersici]